MQTQDQDEEITGINVTPLVDVMLVLLIIFMVTANYIAQSSIKLELPKAVTKDDGVNQSFNFTLDKDSNLFLDGKKMTWESLDSTLESLIDEKKKSGHNLEALVAADKQTPHGEVVKLMDHLRKQGVTNFAIQIEHEK